MEKKFVRKIAVFVPGSTYPSGKLFDRMRKSGLCGAAVKTQPGRVTPMLLPGKAKRLLNLREIDYLSFIWSPEDVLTLNP